jgi:hypothetical protein
MALRGNAVCLRIVQPEGVHTLAFETRMPMGDRRFVLFLTAIALVIVKLLQTTSSSFGAIGAIGAIGATLFG